MKKCSSVAESFFREKIDWPLFYEEKMAICELVGILQGEPDEKMKHASEWLEGVLNLMDEMGDTAEKLGLFEYPERDLHTDRCFDERYNDVLQRSPMKDGEEK